MNSGVTHCVTIVTKLFPKMALSNNKLYVLVIYAIEQNTIHTSIKEEVWYVCITIQYRLVSRKKCGMFVLQYNTIQYNTIQYNVCITFVNVLRTLLHLINNAKSHIWSKSKKTYRKKQNLTENMQFKIVNGQVPDYLTELVPPTVADTNNYNLRNRLNISQPSYRLSTYQVLFSKYD